MPERGRPGLPSRSYFRRRRRDDRRELLIAREVSEFADLVRATAKNFQIKSVSADRAYMSRRNLGVVADAGGTAYIPFKGDHKGDPRGSAHWERLWHLFWFQRSEFERHYRQRSNVEATFSAVKRKFGGSVRAKDFVAQTIEVLAKILAFNITVIIHEMRSEACRDARRYLLAEPRRDVIG